MKNAEADVSYPEAALGIFTAPRGQGDWQLASVQDAAIWTLSSSGSSHPTTEQHGSRCAAGQALPLVRRHRQPASGMADGKRMNPCVLWNKLQQENGIGSLGKINFPEKLPTFPDFHHTEALQEQSFLFCSQYHEQITAQFTEIFSFAFQSKKHKTM